MKHILFFTSLIFLKCFFLSVKAEEALTIKQQLDRIQLEVSDLNRAVFNKSFDPNDNSQNISLDDTERFTSIDIRIYDLEKDIKNLTLQFEEVIFRLDDIANYIQKIETEFNSNLEDIKNNSKIQKKFTNSNDLTDISEIKEENTLGTLVLSEESSNISTVEQKNPDEETLDADQEINNLSSEEQLQFALDQMMKKNYDKSKSMLQKFILNFPENQLSGSAHFWLGKIYQFETNYRKAAIIFGEGVQKFPNSIKAAEMYYELAKSLKEMSKTSEACKTLDILNQNYNNTKFSKDPEKIKDSLKCNDLS